MNLPIQLCKLFQSTSDLRYISLDINHKSLVIYSVPSQLAVKEKFFQSRVIISFQSHEA